MTDRLGREQAGAGTGKGERELHVRCRNGVLSVYAVAINQITVRSDRSARSRGSLLHHCTTVAIRRVYIYMYIYNIVSPCARDRRSLTSQST